MAATGHLPGIITKNLLLTDRRRERLWLVCVPWARRVDMAALGRLLGAGKLQFACAAVLGERPEVDQGVLSLLAMAAPRHGIAALVVEPSNKASWLCR